MTTTSIFSSAPWTNTIARIGHGKSIGHCGEIFQGVSIDKFGKPHRCLVTLPCTDIGASAAFTPDETGIVKPDETDTIKPDDRGTVAVVPLTFSKSKQAAVLTLRHLGLDKDRIGGVLLVRCNIKSQWGCGASTACVVASIEAVADTFNAKLTASEIARIAVEAETASDSTMFTDYVPLFAQRKAIVLEILGERLPALVVLACNTDTSGSGVNTLQLPPANYGYTEYQAFLPLIGALRSAIRNNDAGTLARVASASARISQQFLPKPNFEQIEAIVQEVGALGFNVAHSGSAIGLLFEPGSTTEQRINHAREMLTQMGFGPFWTFETAKEGNK